MLGHVLKVSRVDSLASLPLYLKHKKDLSHEQADYGAFAVGAAIWRRSHANAWPMMLEGWASLRDQPDDALAAAAREAIRRSAWPKLLEITSAMRLPMRSEATWQYWRAMALMQTQQRQEAEEILRDLRDDFGFYGLLAQEMLGASVRLPARPEITLSAEDQKKLDRDSGIRAGSGGHAGRGGAGMGRCHAASKRCGTHSSSRACPQGGLLRSHDCRGRSDSARA
jgi:hypothetical protein